MNRVKRIPSLDGLRAIAISMVVLGHMAKSGHAPRIFLEYYATVGVQIFFVISGFLITGILLREHDQTASISLTRFYARRSLRIFPAALVFLFFAFAFFWKDLRWYNMLAALLYVANHDASRPWILGHLWSLSIEEQFYLLWPSVLKRWYRHRVRILIGVAIFCPVLQTLLYAVKVRNGGPSMLPTIGDNLAAGCLLAVFASRITKIRPLVALVSVAVILSVPQFAANTPFRTLFMLFALRPLFYLAIATLILHVVQSPYRILNWAPIAWLGQISYSLYLWQQPFCSDPHMRSPWMAIGALGCACLSYYLVEQPILRWRDGQSAPAPHSISTTTPSPMLQAS
jgi:peptidoglycan/LPS O-acetylase OafA/YrhL